MLLTEMTLLQGRFDKYDDLIFRNRGWIVAIVTALLGATLTTKRGDLAILAAAGSVVFWILEIIWRAGYWYSYVVRYRHIRDALNRGEPLEAISLYDLTNHYVRKPKNRERFANSAFKLEPFVFYGILLIGSLAIHLTL